MFSRVEADAADGAVDSWLERLDAAGAGPSSRAATQVRYVLTHREIYYVPRVEIDAFAATVLRDGTLSNLRPIDVLNMTKLAGSFVTPIDRTVGRLAGVSGVARPVLAAPTPPILGTLLDIAIETGRLHWKSGSNPPLKRNAIARGRLTWRTDPDGRQRPTLVDRPRAVFLPAKPVWYVDPATMEAGPVELGIAPELAAIAVSSPALTQRQAERSQIVWRRAVAPGGADAPASRTPAEFVDDDPIPVLRLDAARFAFAELRFAYGGREVGAADRDDAFQVAAGPSQKIWPRRRDAEDRARKRLIQAGFTPVEPDEAGNDPRLLRDAYRLGLEDDAGWARFVHVGLPRLRADGWRVEFGGSFGLEIVEPGDDWDARFVENENHWFDLDLGITIQGERVALLPILVEALRERGRLGRDARAEGEPLFARLPSGAYAVLPAERVNRLLATLVELFDTNGLTADGRLALTAAHVGVLDEIVRDGGIRWDGGIALRTLVERLNALPAGRTVTVPAEFQGTLRSYQHDGVAWLQMLREYGFGAVLADDMGLGKTVQLLAHAAIERAHDRLTAPILIVAPTSVVPNWRAEIARFTPHLRVLSLTGAERAERFEHIGDHDVVLTTYALLQRDADRLLPREWSLAVLDEAQAVKNPRSKGAQHVRRLRARQRIALTGTPIENHLDELWSIFAFAVPALLGERAAFARRFRTPIEKRNDLARRKALALRVRPFLLRRTKEAVEADLPPKSEIVARVELDGAQRDLYETIRLAMHKRVRDEVNRRGVERSRIVVLDALLKLRQVCCDPRLVKLPAARAAKGSAKLEALLDMLPDLLADGRRILLFSQFTSMLDLIKPELLRLGVKYVELRGATRDRVTPVARFQSGEIPLFLISLKAGGTGLNLTAADTVIHYDPWWNPAVVRQATDRAHRIGQEHPVFVYKLVTVGTVEERILEMQARKAALADGIFEDAAGAAPLDADAIDRLFAPFG
ncbi:MAG: DEAD/DEAH box helicase [Candidatus Tumulicola sp.]